MLSNTLSLNSNLNPEEDFLRRNDEALRRIALFAELSESFYIGFVEIAQEGDDALVVQILESRPVPGVQWISLRLDDPDLRHFGDAVNEALEPIPREPNQKAVLLICGLEKSIGGYGDYPPILVNLNSARDSYNRLLPYPILFLLPGYALTRLMRFAPDFWYWRSLQVALHRDLPTQKSEPIQLSLPLLEPQVKTVSQSRFKLLQRLLQESEDSSVSRGDILNQLGIAYESQGKYTEAKSAYLQALDIYRALNRPIGEAEVLYNLGKLYKRDKSVVTLEEAEEFLQQQIQINKKLGDLRSLGMGLSALGGLYSQVEPPRYSEAESLYIEALEIRRRLFKEDHEDVATSLNNLGTVYHLQSRYSEAESLYIEALEMRRRLFPGDHKGVALSLNSLGGLYFAQSRYSEAEPLYKEALEMGKRLFPGNHPDVATSLNNLGELYKAQSRYSEAEPLLREALEMRKSLFPGDHLNVADSLHSLGVLYYTQSRYSEAEPLYKEALGMRKRLFTGDHPDVATSLNNLGTVYYTQSRYSEAEPLFREALEMRKRLFTGDHPDVATSLNNLGAVYYTQSRYSEAEPLFREALEMRKRLFLLIV